MKAEPTKDEEPTGDRALSIATERLEETARRYQVNAAIAEFKSKIWYMLQYRSFSEREAILQAARNLITRTEQQTASAIKELEKYKMFHDHIKAHFEVEHPDWKVTCKICGSPFDKIIERELKKKHLDEAD